MLNLSDEDLTAELDKRKPDDRVGAVPDHVHVAIGHSEHEGDAGSGPVFRGDRTE